jgi:hypothetical protein
MERRLAPRVAVRLDAAYEDPERQVFLASRDLSEAGIYLLLQDPPRPGAAARVLLELPGHPALLRLPAVVARCDAGVGFALAFDSERMPAGSREALRGFARGAETESSQ